MPDSDQRGSRAADGPSVLQAHREDNSLQARPGNYEPSHVRELHHRVKNSLQIIRSIISISRRENPESSLLFASIEARVSVISTAYRIALSAQGVTSVPLRAFMEDLAAELRALLLAEKHQLSVTINCERSLDVDRVIPLGLAIAEAAIAIAQRRSDELIAVFIDENGPLELSLRLSVSPIDGKSAGNARILEGLRLQLGAIMSRQEPGDKLNWRFAL